VLSLYRLLSVRVLKPWLAKKFFSDPKARAAIFNEPTRPKKGPRVWFHASSVGELEMLIPVIDAVGVSVEVVVTAFSDSAADALELLRMKLLARLGPRLIFMGFAPWEGEWERAFGQYQPDHFVTARYEAWPELWASLGERRIPLAIVGARARRSLRVAARFVKFFGRALPPLKLCAIDESEVAALRRDFPAAEVRVTGDPRWERVFDRAALENPRATQLKRQFSSLARPWGILGSAWITDLKFAGPDLFAAPGTIWLVPHDVDPTSIAEFEAWLRASQVPFSRSASREAPVEGVKCVLVDEMGLLLEFYSSADWAYVGGGFGRAVHNTVEPAIHGIPLSCGPARADRFPEIELLQGAGQLRVLRSRGELKRWLVEDAISSVHKTVWRENALRQRGAAKRIIESLRVSSLRT
jgi:3-deoxy-D-manno-octulosonic-acid transferase